MEWSTSCEDDSLTWETFSAVEDDDSDGDPDDIDDCEDGDRIDAVQLECPNSHTSLCKVAFPALHCTGLDQILENKRKLRKDSNYHFQEDHNYHCTHFCKRLD